MTLPSEGDALAALLDEAIEIADEPFEGLPPHPKSRSGRRLGSVLAEARAIVGVRMPGSSDADIPEWAPECLAMIRETLTEIGMDMKGCPPMMYNDAVRNLAVVLGRKAGFATWQEIRAYVSEQQGTIAQPSEP